MYRKNSTNSVQYYLLFKASTWGLRTNPLRILGNCCVFMDLFWTYCFFILFIKTRTGKTREGEHFISG